MTTSNRRIKRSAPELLVETHIEVEGERITLRKNLGPLSLTSMMSQVRVKNEVRGLMVGDDIYYWDAFFATHAQVSSALGIEYEPKNRVFVWRTMNGAILVDRGETTHELQKPLMKLVDSPNIYFCDVDGEWKNGQQIAA